MRRGEEKVQREGRQQTPEVILTCGGCGMGVENTAEAR